MKETILALIAGVMLTTFTFSLSGSNMCISSERIGRSMVKINDANCQQETMVVGRGIVPKL